jgi:HSP20 family protein
MTSPLRGPVVAEPFRLMDALVHRMLGNGVSGWVPQLDVRETESEYVILADLPGVRKEDVSIELSDQTLTISGTRVSEETGEAQTLERPHGSFVRSLTLPKGVDHDRIVADYADGVLTLRIPKPAGLRPKRIAIAVGHQAALEQ